MPAGPAPAAHVPTRSSTAMAGDRSCSLHRDSTSLRRRLAAGQENHAGNRRGHRAPQHGSSARPPQQVSLLRVPLPGTTMPVSIACARARRGVDATDGKPLQHGLGDLGATSDRLIAVDQHLGFDDRHDALLLADGGVTRKCLRVGFNCQPARQRVGDVINSAPPAKRAPCRL